MNNIKYQQRTIKVSPKSTVEAEFSSIHGALLGFATIPSDDKADADLVIKDGANAILEPLDVRLANVLKANNFLNSITPLKRENPGTIKAEVSLNDDTADYEVKVILFYSDTNKSIRDCNCNN